MKKWLKWLLVVAVGGAGLYALLAFLTGFRATRMVNNLLNEWATQQVTAQSDSIYQLRIGQLHFNWPLRRVTLDSAIITTDSARNARLTYPLPTVYGALSSCTISGIDLPRLVLRKGLKVSQIGCARVVWNADSPPDSAALAMFAAGPQPKPKPAARPAPTAPQTDSGVAPARQSGSILVSFQHRLKLPDQVPTIRIGRVVFPALGTTMAMREPNGDRATFDLARARLDVTDIVIDSADAERADRPLFAMDIEFRADSAEFRPDTAQVVRVGMLAVSLADSSVLIDDFEQGPRISDAEFQSRSPYRRDRIRLRAAHLAIRGFNRTEFARRGAIMARAVELDSFRFEIRADKRKPKRPGPKTIHRAPQTFFNLFPRLVSVDTVKATNAVVVYEEFAPRRDRPGRLTISQVSLLAIGTRHEPGRRSSEPMTLDIRGKVMGRGTLNAHFEVPLDAGSFNMRARGSIGPFDAMIMNELIEHIQPARIKSGQIDGVEFQFTVTNGMARGTLTPRYHNLGADITGQGMTGVLGRGAIGGVIRGVAEAAQGLKVRSSNPANPNEAPRVGTISHQFAGEALPSFFWNCIKGGLLPVVVK